MRDSPRHAGDASTVLPRGNELLSFGTMDDSLVVSVWIAWLLSMASAVFFASAAWVQRMPRLGGAVLVLGRSVMMVPLGMAAMPILVAVAFPMAGLLSAFLMLLGLAMAAPLGLLWFFVFGRARTAAALALTTLAVVAAYATSYAAYQAMQEREMRQRHAKAERIAAAELKRKREALAAPESRAQAIRRNQPLVAEREPYRAAMACLGPMQERVFHFQREHGGRWPATLDEAGIATPGPACLIENLNLGPEGELRAAVHDPQAQDLKRRRDPSCRPEECGPPASDRIELRLIPHRRESGELQWLCTSPQSRVFEGLSGCGRWSP